MVLGVVCFLVLLVGDGLYAVSNLRGALETGATQLDRGAVLFEQGNLQAAEAEFTGALSEMDRAVGSTRRPSLVLGSYLPVLGRDARALAALARAGRLVARAGLEGLEAGKALGMGTDGIAATLYVDGRVALEPMSQAAPSVVAAADLLQRAQAYVDAITNPTIGLISDAAEEAKERIADAAGTAEDGRLLFQALPGMLGADGSRRYLLAFQAPGEARGAGGVAGLYGILHATDGRFRLGEIGPYGELFGGLRRPVEAPGWFAAAYGTQGALTEWPQANVSPNFPAVAGVMMQMYRAEAREPVDGVLAMDPIVLETMMRATGPITVEGPQGDRSSIAAGQVVDLLLRDAYLEFEDPADQDRFLISLVNAFWSKIQAGDFDPARLGAALGEAVRSQHLKSFAAEPQAQALLSELGASGDYPVDDGMVQLVFHNNYGVNKVDYFLRRSIDTRIELGEDGTARVTTAVELENRAPDGPPSFLLGLGPDGVPPGTNRMLLSYLLPQGAAITSLDVGGAPRTPLLYQDDRNPVGWFLLDLPPGGSETATLTYEVPNAVSSGRFSLTLVPQATINTEQAAVTIVPPPGYRLRDTGAALPAGNGAVTIEGPLDRAFEVRATVVPV